MFVLFFIKKALHYFMMSLGHISSAVKYLDKHKYFDATFFFQFHWEIIDIHPCIISSRHTTWWFNLDILWNDYHNRFSYHPSSHTKHNKTKQQNKNPFMVSTLGNNSLNNFRRYHAIVLIIVIMFCFIF